ncbi:hypothetical protein ENSA5_43490 [Enhygromyxa salina]|uniref:Uncharacterized protein n=1 Tax=Enhygromyxa salina TaxID=215803 RepID=A0A2S9XK49_9BACT|nr:hypothetical protein [Enhygromyxa salina]PRP93254.1 hypothetical protein ENSA5_43490 [Enhygromyxa salina]
MRARRTRATLCAALLLAAPLASCTKNNPSTNVKIAGEGDGPGEGGRLNAEAGGAAVEREPIEKIEIAGSVTGVGDMLDAGAKLLNMWSPPEPGAPPIDLRSFIGVMLIQEGFGPGFLESIDLDGVHAMELGFPHEGQPGVTDADVDLSLVFSAIDPVRAIESMPAGMQPQPLGDNLWQLAENDSQLFFRAGSGALEVALSMDGLDVANGLRAQVAVGPDEPRVKVAAANVPPVDIDVSDMLPLPRGMANTLSSIINETKSLELTGDFGSDRDLRAQVSAEAPFGRLGLDPIGPATQAPSELAEALPGEAMGVWVMPWGDPKLLHDALDRQIPVDQIPAPFDGYVDEVVAGAHGILGAVRNEVLAAAYIDKGKFTLVLAAEVDDEAAARDAIREVFGAAEKAFGDHIALAGNSSDHAYKVSFKKSVVRAGKAKGDLFTLTIPKAMQAALDDLGWFFGTKKPQVEVASVVVDGKLIVALGVGQKAMMSAIGRRVGKSSDAGLEAGGGLALARKLTQGCQYCIAVDPSEVGEMVFTTLSADQSQPEEVHKAAAKARDALAKLGLDGEVAFALRFDQDRGSLGFGVPKSLLFADPAKIKSVVDLAKSIDEAREAAWAKTQ